MPHAPHNANGSVQATGEMGNPQCQLDMHAVRASYPAWHVQLRGALAMCKLHARRQGQDSLRMPLLHALTPRPPWTAGPLQRRP